ncbi:hypothetical protein NP233_g587 [Leucocoprinus birnbaumii]|uniref:Uncharacterized protein n=1 Tax=Leucocoprinus birnbaumii TaxID=56174 RepID=A0AAD5W224_9AGAR|nr:hypothetical protein NP233_g587 [Leucocoprinus birnbaumii]
MSFLLAGRSFLVAPLLASLTLLLFLVLSPSHPVDRPHIYKRDVVHVLEQRRKDRVTTTEVTTTIFTTSSATLSVFPEDASLSVSSHTHHHGHSTAASAPPSSSTSPSSAGFSSSSSSSTSSLSPSVPLTSSTSSTSFFVASTTSSTSSHVLAPTPLSPTPATTLFVTDDPLSAVSPTLPTSPSQAHPAPSSPPIAVDATSTGFWSNKGAVGGVFTVVGLIIAGILVFLLVTYIKRVKKNRSRRYDEELYSTFFDQGGHSRNGSSNGPSSLNYPPIDPFAAGEVVQVLGSAASLHHGFSGTAVGSSSPPGSKTGHGGYVSDDGHSSHGHSSSMHHGFSSISYHTGHSGSRANLARSDSPTFSQLPKSAPLPVSYPKSHTEDPFSNAAAVPLSANTVSSTYTVPSPLLGAGQVIPNRQADSDASYYADQIHSYYYGAGATAPSAPRSFGQAF